MGEPEVAAIAHVIQLSVAPVFLLSGIGAMLAVMTKRKHMPFQIFVLFTALLPTSQTAARIALPTGVVGVSFGTAQRYKDAAGKEMCAIVRPLPDPPVFEREILEISYAVQLKPRTVKSASTQVIAPGEQGYLQRTPCNAFEPVKGGFSQTLLGSTITRLDKKPLQSGSYILRMTVDGQTADVPFAIK